MDSSFLAKKELIDNLWAEYQKSSDYRQGYIKGIAKEHLIILGREEKGLRELLNTIRKELSNKRIIYHNSLQQRKPADWVTEWSSWHRTLFKYVLRSRGRYRNINVRFGSLGDEEIHKIPPPHLIVEQLGELAQSIQHIFSNVDNNHIDEIIKQMAQVHYKFIRIHPFPDGNGRIGRLLIDQLAIANNLPMAMGGYPRSNSTQRRNYHKAITDCAYDHHHSKLRFWIKEKIQDKIEKLS